MSAPRLCFPLGGGGGGGGIGGGGTPNRLAMFTAANTISDSAIIQTAGAIQTLTLTNAGTGATNGTYAQVALTTTTGSGTGATADIVVAGNVVTTLVLRSPGSGYAVGNTLSCATIGGSGFVFTVSAVSASDDASGNLTALRLGAGTSAPRSGFDLTNGLAFFSSSDRLVRRSVGATAVTIARATLYANPTVVYTASDSIYGLIDAYPFVDCRGTTGSASLTAINAFPQITGSNVGQTLTSRVSNWGIYRTDANDVSNGTVTLAGFSGQGGVVSGVAATQTTTIRLYGGNINITASGHTIGTFEAFASTGSFFNVASTITNFYGFRQLAHTGSGTITNRWGISIEDAATKSAFWGNVGVGNALDVGAGKIIGSLTLTNAGTGYTNGSYQQVALTTVTGTGSGATADIIVAGGIVTTVFLRNPGQGYAVSDTLSCASIGAGSNFLLTVATTASILRSDGTAVASRIGAGTAAPVAAMDAVGGSIVRSSFLYNYNYNSGTNFQIRAHLGIDSSAEPSGATVLASTDSGPAGIVCRPIYDATAITGNIFANGISVLPQISAPSGGTVGITGFAVSPQVNAIGMTGKTVSIIGVSSGGQINNQGAGNSASLTAFSGAVGVFSSTATIAITALTQVTAGGSVSGVAHTVTDFHWYRGTGSTFNNGVVVTNFYGLRLGAPTLAGGATITNRWAINQEDTAAKSLFAGNVGIGVDPLVGKMIASLTLTAGGTLYTNGTYSQVALTGGSGTGATADIVISGNAVTTVVLRSPGQGYVVGDILSVAAASVGGTGSGFQTTVATVASTIQADGEIIAPRIGAGTTTPVSAAHAAGSFYSGRAELLALSFGPSSGVAFASASFASTSVNEPSGAYQIGASQLIAYGGVFLNQFDAASRSANTTAVGIFSSPIVTVGCTSGTLSVTSVRAWGAIDSADVSKTYSGFGVNAAFQVNRVGTGCTFASYAGVLAQHSVSATTAATFTNAALFDGTSFFSGAAHAITDLFGLRLRTPTLNNGSTITNRYPIAQEDTLGTNFIRAKTHFGAAVGTAAATTASIEVTAQGTLNGDIRLNSANAVVDVSAASTNGVKFNNRGGAGITSTTQNWYEEGTYTPTFSAAWTPGSFTATWTRIGRKVFITISFAAGTTNGTSGAATITVPVGLTPARPGAGIRARPDGTASGNGVVGVDTAGLIQISTAITLDTNAKVIQCEYEV